MCDVYVCVCEADNKKKGNEPENAIIIVRTSDFFKTVPLVKTLLMN